MKKVLFGVCCILFFAACKSGDKVSKTETQSEWEELFNGKDLTGWSPKIGGYEFGVNAMNTFQVHDGVIEANYDEYDTFTTQYGHLFYKEPFSSYHLEVDYRFKGNQTPGGAGWAVRNSGVMFHCQDPKTMTLSQYFPICVEFQFLGGNGKVERSTGNLCTPNSHVEIDGELVTTHCINSNSKTYHGDGWVTSGLIVYADSIVHHLIEGDTVMTYRHPIFDENGAEGNYHLKDGEPMKSGYIALQSESNPVEFRNVRIKRLK
ncbi:3-keto-disaccharide hydrolase [Portibacter lacus]|uniref:3-keto-alpha-glucoside-1,2-lyase/3-keto-2-hydroxy-glucal hydratase domain-containing protein n=1 Tax=Portibacter lacus TaxID=1099794 RepID=A0AA37SNL5_9BACT|nr:DUF1080 domain-containing protein [Portibacter lacus]GLR15933.1 hypothetical protein GCM10007940_05480 [Portibacter lacus]